MYTASITGRSIQRANKQIVVDVAVDDGSSSFTEKFVFALDTSFEEVKKAVKRYVARLEAAQTGIDAIAEGALDLSAVSTEPVPGEQAKHLWLQRDALRDQVDIAIKKGYLTGSEPKVTQLKSWLQSNFKPEYLGDL